MPFVFLFIGICLGILCAAQDAPLLTLLLCLSLGILYKVLKRRFLWICWLIPLAAGIATGSLLGLIHFGTVYYSGELCEGYVSKIYQRSVSVKIDECAENVNVTDIFYTSCKNQQCPTLNSRIQIRILDAKRFGRFAGKGETYRETIADRSPIRKVYYLLLSEGNMYKMSYFRWLREVMPVEHSSLITSMIFGDTELPEDLTDTMKKIGLLHIVAISGINITYLLTLLSLIFKYFERRWRVILEILVLLLLFLIVGEAVSLIRAVIMSFWGIFKRRVGIRSSIWAFLGGLSLLLVLDPNYLWDAGFLLVSGACFGIYVGSTIIKKVTRNGMLSNFLQGVVIWIFVAPIQYIIFKTVTVYGVLIGFVLGPFVEVLTMIGYISSVSRVLPAIGELSRYFLGILSSVILFVIALFHE